MLHGPPRYPALAQAGQLVGERQADLVLELEVGDVEVAADPQDGAGQAVVAGHGLDRDRNLVQRGAMASQWTRAPSGPS